VAFAARRDPEMVSTLRSLLRRDVEVYVVPRLHELGRDGRFDEESLPCLALQRLRPAASVRASWRAKRTFDVVVALGGLLLLAPFLGVLAVGVRMSGPGGVLFRQQRVGQHGRVFELLKFRSLRANGDSDVTWSVAGDPRQTPIGAWMRRFSVDELPQLWNVVRGDMSLVGPRPERPHFVAAFGTAVPGYHDRHRLPVGLTGLAQIHGLRGDTSIDERARFDNHYIDHWSLLRDMSILAATVASIIRDGRRARRA
jgi:lipopolysaccharide/colanic/teichoic acid biosynthesis glycosyltransferase